MCDDDFFFVSSVRLFVLMRPFHRRLGTLIPFGFIYAVGMIVLFVVFSPVLSATTHQGLNSGVGLANGWPWEAVIILGYGCIGAATSSLPTIAITYAVDCVRLPPHTRIT